MSQHIGTTLRLKELALKYPLDGIIPSFAALEFGLSCDRVANLLWQAALKGSMWRVHSGRRWRYFGDPVHAQAYAKRHGLQMDKPPERAKHKQANDLAFSPPVVTFGRGPAHMDGEPVITEHTRIVRQDFPDDARFAVREAPRVVDSAQCRPWARR